MMRVRRRLLALAAVAALGSAQAAAQAPAAPQTPPVRVRGTVAAFDGHTLTVAKADGTQAVVALAADFKVRAVVKKSLADIKDGDFVGSATVKGDDGKLHAIEVSILPSSLRGVAREGQFPWDLQPGSLMTNATAAGIAAAPQGQVMHLTWKDGAADIVVGPDTPVVGFAAGDPSLLKPGAAVFVTAARKPDGSLSAPSVTAEKDGVKPPL